MATPSGTLKATLSFLHTVDPFIIVDADRFDQARIKNAAFCPKESESAALFILDQLFSGQKNSFSQSVLGVNSPCLADHIYSLEIPSLPSNASIGFVYKCNLEEDPQNDSLIYQRINRSDEESLEGKRTLKAKINGQSVVLQKHFNPSA